MSHSSVDAGSVCENCGAYSRFSSGQACSACGASGVKERRRGLALAAGLGAMLVVAVSLWGAMLQRTPAPAVQAQAALVDQKADAAATGPQAMPSDPRKKLPADKPPGRTPPVKAPAASTRQPVKAADAIEWANLGATEVAQGRLREAEAAYSKALSLEPENWLAHYNFGLLELRRGRKDAAYAHWQRSLRSLDGSDPALAREVRRQLAKEPACAGLRGEELFHALVGR